MKPRRARPLRLSLHPPALSSPLFIVSRGLHTPHTSPVYEAPADCGTDGVCPTRHPCTQHPARAQPSFPSQAALPKLLLLPPPSSARRVHSSSFLMRNEKRCDRNARAVSNLFTEADSVPRSAAGASGGGGSCLWRAEWNTRGEGGERD
jgi:hypothetical protein